MVLPGGEPDDLADVVGLDHDRPDRPSDRPRRRQLDRVPAALHDERLQPPRGAVARVAGRGVRPRRPHEGRVLQRWFHGQPDRYRCRSPMGARAGRPRPGGRRTRWPVYRALYLDPGPSHRPAIRRRPRDGSRQRPSDPHRSPPTHGHPGARSGPRHRPSCGRPARRRHRRGWHDQHGGDRSTTGRG